MTSLASALYNIKYNPFRYGEFLVSFYSTLTNVKQNLLLSQLVIPLCSHHLFVDKLSNAKFGVTRRSTMWTVFRDKSQMYDLQERLDAFKRLTDQSLQYCLVNDWLQIDTHALTVSPYRTKETQFVIQKSAANLGNLFSDFSAIEIYSFLGVAPR